MLLGQQALLGFTLILFVWLAFLSVWLFRTVSHYNKLTGKTGREDLKSVLDQLIRQQVQVEQKLRDVLLGLEVSEKKSLANFKKIGIIKFNPFSEAGGNHSFALCLLDGEDTGFIILSLHGREGTRLYLKEVKQGHAQYELSKEEHQALVSAKRLLK